MERLISLRKLSLIISQLRKNKRDNLDLRRGRLET